MIPLQLVANLCQSTAPHGMHLPITQIITLNPEMHSITGNIDVAVQDQPIADLSAHALILKPRSLRILNAWEASQNERGRFEGTNSKSYRRRCFSDTAGSASNPAHISIAMPNALEAPAAWEASQRSRKDLKVRSPEI